MGNAIGAHSGNYSVYKALALAAGQLQKRHRPDFTNTTPAEPMGPFPSWHDPKKIVSLDPLGHMIQEAFRGELDLGYDIRPSIAITKAHIEIPELKDPAISDVKPDGVIMLDNYSIVVTKAAVEPVWYLPGIAERFKITENDLRRTLYQETGGMYPELITRNDIKTFLPPIGGHTIYIMGDPKTLSDPKVRLTCRVHDECNGSDVFGSDICTCRPYLVHGISEAVREAQNGGNGLIIYNRKEGRALGEVTKFLVYNARKRQEGGDRAEKYFERTECIAGVPDMRFQELMPDCLHWLGISKIDQFISMSDMKHDNIVASGIQIVERVPIPDHMVPEDAQVEIDAKIYEGYYAAGKVIEKSELEKQKGRNLDQ